MKNRIEFNMHSNYSRMNGIKSPKEIIERAIELGMDTIAITDIGSVKGLPRAYDYIKMHSKKIKLIIGMEAFYAQGRIYCDVKNEDNFSRIIILAKNETGRKNLYKLISAYYKNGYAELTTRDGLLIGTNGLNSSIIHCLVVGKSNQEVKDSINEYDFILVNPLNYHEHVKQIVSYAKETETLVIASNSPYYFSDNESFAREVLRFADNKDTEMAEDLTLYSTEDMLNAFDYLGDNTEDVVINNGYKLADMIEDDIPPIPHGTYRPNIAGAFKYIKNRAVSKAMDLYKINVTHYGYDLPEPVKTRLETELEFIEKNGFEFNFFIPMEVAEDSKKKGYPVMSGYVAGSSFVAYLLGLTNVNPLKPHYRCSHRYKDECNYIEFVDGYESGFDLPAKKCPRCGRDLIRDGHNIPYETIFGFNGDKEPDIDLKLCEEYRIHCIEYSEKQFGKGVIRSGIYSSLHEKTAEYLVDDYINKTQTDCSDEEKENITELCVGAFRKTGLNPAKLFIIPSEYEIEDFTPIEIIEDDYFGRVAVTHYDCFNALHDTLLNIDVMGFDAVQMLKLLKEKTGVEPTENDIADNAKLLKAIKEGNTDSIPEMYSDYVRKMIEHTKPEKFSDFVALNGLAHGTGVYEDNAKELFAEGVCDFESVIAFRENILLYLDKTRKEYTEKTGKEAPLSYLDCYKISEITRKGRAERDLPEYEDALKEIGVPDWYIESAKKIKYLFPKAHSVEYMIASFRLLWYKLYCPKEFQEADYEVNNRKLEAFPKLDSLLRGKWQSEGFNKEGLILIDAKPPKNKISFAAQLACDMSQYDKRVAYFSYETAMNRFKNHLRKDKYIGKTVLPEGIKSINLAFVEYVIEKMHIDIAVLDFYNSDFEEYESGIANKLRKLSEKYHIPIIATLNTQSKIPVQIEQEAIVIISVKEDENSDDGKTCDFIIVIEKNMYGGIGTVNLTYDSKKRLFKEV